MKQSQTPINGSPRRSDKVHLAVKCPQEVVSNLNQLTGEEVEELTEAVIDRGKFVELSDDQRDTMDALEVSMIDFCALEDSVDFVFDSGDETGVRSLVPAIEDESDDVEFGKEIVVDLIQEFYGEIRVGDLAAKQIAARTVEVPTIEQPRRESTFELEQEISKPESVPGVGESASGPVFVEIDGASLGYSRKSKIFVDDDIASQIGWEKKK